MHHGGAGVEHRVEQYDWIYEFRRRAAPRLALIFEKDLGSLPQELLGRLERLRRTEQELTEGEPKRGGSAHWPPVD